MTPVPREPPRVPGLNSFYVDVPRLVEHCQGEFGTGCTTFRGNGVLAQLFFDKEAILSGSYVEGQESLAGDRAVHRILGEAPQAGFEIQVQAIPTTTIYLWANVPGADLLYGDLSTEFTDLMGLIRKMGRESLSGYIEVCPQTPEAGGVVFLSSGKVVGGSYPDMKAPPDSEQEKLQQLIARNNSAPAVFHVGRFSDRPLPDIASESAPGQPVGQEVLPAIEELLNAVGDLFATARCSTGQYHTMVNRKFLEKSEMYPFLDPFAAEFTFRGSRVQCQGEPDQTRLTPAVVGCLQELAGEQRVLEGFRSVLANWSARHGHLLVAALADDTTGDVTARGTP